MNTFDRFLRTAVSTLLGAVLTLALMVFAASLVLAATVGATVWAAWRLVTGRRPVLGLPGLLIQRAWALRRGGAAWGPGSGQHAGAGPAAAPRGEVVDVDARFLPEGPSTPR